MMHFTIRLMQILRQTFGWLYSFIASIASIKADIAFILFISVFMVLVPIKATHIKTDTKKYVQNIESEDDIDDIEYAAQSAIDIDISILEQNNRLFIQTGFMIVFLILLPCVLGYFNIAPFAWGPIDDDQHNHNQNNIHRNMNGNPFRFQED